MAFNPLQLLMQAGRGGGNPVQMLQGMMQQNPMCGQVYNIVNGKSPQQLEQIARNMARERGIDINQMARQIGINI